MREAPAKPVGVLLVLLAGATAVWLAFPTPFVRGLVVGVFAGPALVTGVLAIATRRLRKRANESLLAPPLPVDTWDYDLRATALGGDEVDFASFKGRVLVLNFWATWCAPCVAEMPSLAGLEEATADLDVSLACVTSEPSETVERFIAKRGSLGVPIYLLADEAPAMFRSRGIPATFVLDKNGLRVLSHTGAASWDAPAVVAFVRGLAAVPVR